MRQVRSAKTGDLAHIEIQDGREVVVLPHHPSRPASRPIPYRPEEWIEESNPRTMSRMDSAQVAFVADKQLLHWLGDHARARKDWISLREEDRLKFCEEGPQEPKIRRLLYRCIMAALEPLRKDDNG